MVLSEEYLHKVQEQLELWEAELDEIQEQMEQDDVDLEFQDSDEMSDLRRQFENLMAMFEDLQSARGADEEEELKAVLDEAMMNFRTAFNEETQRFHKDW